ncbi:MAG: cupin domain-containing protein [Gammaproteobacteria bacterium]|nr:cupin domain-containing protein [Gammaproteobacteria bacterium]
MEITSTLRVIDKSQVKPQPGVVAGQTVQPLVGVPDFPSERVRVAVATFQPGVHEELHWHPIEVFYYVMMGSAIVRDYHGKEYPVGPGSSIYAPAGIAGSHEWQVGKDGLQLLSIRAALEGHKRMQFTVDRKTRRSYIELEELAKMDGVSFKSHY